jgi:hypothetical protein
MPATHQRQKARSQRARHYHHPRTSPTKTPTHVPMHTSKQATQEASNPRSKQANENKLKKEEERCTTLSYYAKQCYTYMLNYMDGHPAVEEEQCYVYVELYGMAISLYFAKYF